MDVLLDIKEMMEDELKSICHKKEITRTDLDDIYKMIDIIKDITTINAMHKADEHSGEKEELTRRITM